MSPSAMIAQQNGDQNMTPKVNPFQRINYVNLDEVLTDLKGKDFLFVKEKVVQHMSENGIHAACILCSGAIGKKHRHFVNMSEVPNLVPEVQTIAHLTHLIHWESSSGIVALKVTALKADLN